MAKGRKQTANQVKVLRGTDQPCRMADDVGMTKLLKIPKSGLKGVAQKIYKMVATELMYKDLLEVVGIDLLIAYAREMALYHEIMIELVEEGYTKSVETKFGTNTIINPKRKIASDALANAKALAVEFGFTPASRSRILGALTPKKVEDEFAEFEEVN